MPDGEGSRETTAEEFVELEAELTAPETGATGAYDEGYVAGATRLPAVEVPSDYPVEVGTAEALRVDVDVGPETVSTFLPWPEDGLDGSRLGRLLDALAYDAGQFADLYGDRVALTSRDGWHILDVERTRVLKRRSSYDPQGTRTRAYYGVAATTALSFLAWVLFSVFVVSSPVLLALVAVVVLPATWLALPVTVYLDARTVEEADGWSPRVPFWVAASLVPFARVGVGLVYLLRRRSTIGGWPKPWSWHRLVLVAEGLLLVSTVAVALLSIVDILWLLLPTYLGAWVLAVGSVYYDARYAEEALDWNPLVTLWVGGTVVSFVFAFLWLPAYLLWRWVNTL